MGTPPCCAHSLLPLQIPVTPVTPSHLASIARSQVVDIDRTAKRVTARDLASGAEQQYEYDALVLAPGANAIKPPLPGVDLPGIFKMKDIPDV